MAFVASGVFRAIWNPNDAIAWCDDLTDGTAGLMLKRYADPDSMAHPVTEHRRDHIVHIITGNDPDAEYVHITQPGCQTAYRYVVLCLVDGRLHLRHINTDRQMQRGGQIRNRVPDLVLFKESTADCVLSLYGRIQHGMLALELVAPSGAQVFSTDFHLGRRVSVAMLHARAVIALRATGILGPLNQLKLLNGTVVLKGNHTIWSPRATGAIRVRLFHKQSKAQAQLSAFFRRSA